MQIPIYTQPLFIDRYLAELGTEKSNWMGENYQTCPYDENGVFVPTDKNTPENLKKVQESVQQAYGLKAYK